MLPVGAYLTGLTRFLADLAFSPVKWAGVALLGLGALLYVVSGVLLRRGAADLASREREGASAGERKGVSAGRAPKASLERGAPAVDPDLAEIEEILKKRGIS